MGRESKSDNSRGAQGERSSLTVKFGAWLHHHALSARASGSKVMAAPLQTIMTSLVIAIALALPASLKVMIDNFQQFSDGMESSTQITLYVKKNLSSEGLKVLQQKLGQRKDIAEHRYISADQSLQEYQTMSGLGEVLNLLDENPLPAIIMLQPSAALNAPELIENLVNELREWPGVDDVRLDMEWVQRLHAILEVSRRIAVALALALALGVLLVVGNTIRLAVQNRRDEIVVVKLVGGTDGYVRRPFLYSGVWYGSLGGILAWLMVWVALMWLASAVKGLSTLYQGGLTLTGLGLIELLGLLLSGALLGLIGSWLAVGRHLRDIEPG